MQGKKQQSIFRYFQSLHTPQSARDDAGLQYASGKHLEAGLHSLRTLQSGSEGTEFDDTLDEDSQTISAASEPQAEASNEYTREAESLVRTFTDPSSRSPNLKEEVHSTTDAHENPTSSDGTDTPNADRQLTDVEYVPAPKEYKPSVFGALINSRLRASQLSDNDQEVKQTSNNSDVSTAATTTLKKGWYEHLQDAKSVSKGLLPGSISSFSSASDHCSSDSTAVRNDDDLEKGMAQQQSTVSQNRDADQSNVVAEVADIIASRSFLIELCKAFMSYGAPTHRLEDYMKSAARALQIDATFVYIPGTMTCTFRDEALQSNTIELVRGREGLDFARLKDAFDVYKKVIHETPNPSERKLELDQIKDRADEYTIWFRILLFGLSSVIVGPFSFQARPIDFIPVFFLGCALGFLQLKVVPRSEHFSNVFEVSAAVVAAFAARGLGSIHVNGQYLFCFSAVSQSSIALILPGFMILNSALELQGQSMVAGSVRMIYAIIYVLFLGFGLLLGMTLYGLMDHHAVTETTCHMPTWFEAQGAQLLYTNFIWVPLFACSLALIYRARWAQLPVMAFVSVCGYQAYYWMSTVLGSNPQIANAIGAFVIGCVANLYSRICKGPAATNMLPAIYCLVPGGLAASGSLVAGVQSSEDIVNSAGDAGSSYTDTVFSVGSNAIQICIGTSVGLYLSALVVYPYGKRRSGLFSFS